MILKGIYRPRPIIAGCGDMLLKIQADLDSWLGSKQYLHSHKNENLEYRCTQTLR